jgi:hypothetical protein
MFYFTTGTWRMTEELRPNPFGSHRFRDGPGALVRLIIHEMALSAGLAPA